MTKALIFATNETSDQNTCLLIVAASAEELSHRKPHHSWRAVAGCGPGKHWPFRGRI